jgi:5,10-methenyltetrahydromethanopterin hydrogenase
MKSKEQNLNLLLTECYSEEEAVDQFIYLTNKARGKHTTEQSIRNALRNASLGSLLKRLDPIAFNCS